MDALAIFWMTVQMDLEACEYPANVVERATKLTKAVREYNRSRVGT